MAVHDVQPYRNPGLTPMRVVTVLVIPPVTAAALCAWWAADAAFYAVRLYRAMHPRRTP